MPHRFLWALMVLASAPVGRAADPAPSAVNLSLFEQKIRPLLVQHCLSCHSVASGKKKGGLLLDSREAILKGGDSGPAAIPSDADKSLLTRAVSHQDSELQMPPKGKLAPREIAALRDWIAGGMAYPASSGASREERRIDLVAGKKFWSFQPLAEQTPPVVKDKDWPKGRIDTFILAALEAKRWAPASPASRAALIRRAKFDLLGLPPTPAEVDAVVADSHPDAYARLIDGFLKSTHYGERWGRHWLDLTRYCDIGEAWTETRGQPWHYRDWVIRAINEDMPYPRFARLQLAADQMSDARVADRAALGFIGLSPTYWKELQLPVEIIRTIVSDETEERINALSSTFLGLNMACARCHDHKNDPITAEDYYAVAGVFASTRQADQALAAGIDGLAVAEARQQVAALEAEMKKLMGQKAAPVAEKISNLESRIRALKATPGYDSSLVPGAVDASLRVVEAKGTHGSRIVYESAATDMPVEVRGNPNKPGKVVPRRFVSVLSPGEPRPLNRGSGRLDLADALVEDSGPLMARVIVNRVWKWHFGAGIVDTPSDFGAMGERPSHPGLLEDLAARFAAHGWSLKWLHREIMLSATYTQASGAPQAGDESLRFLSRFPRRRLDIESWRDALLAVSGNLDLSMGGPPSELSADSNTRRTVYGTVRRRELNDLLRLHDFPDPVIHSAARIPTITPLQQLFLLNSPLVARQAATLASRVQKEGPASPAGRIDFTYRLLFGRMPTDGERKIGLDFTGSGKPNAWRDYAHALLAGNEFQFID